MAFRLVIAAVIVGLAGLYGHQLAAERVYSSALPRLDQLPKTLNGWSSEDFPLSETVADVLGADAVVQRLYRHSSGAQVWVFLGYFAQQRVNSQIHSPRHCVPGSGWNVTDLEIQPVQLAHGTIPVARMLLDRNGAKPEQMFYWFRTRGGTVTGEYALKWDLLRNALSRRPTDAVFVRYNALLEHDQPLREFMREMDPYLESILAEVGIP